eukprot:10549137-Heterocapsa_arctica.AAC.1
MDKLVLKKQLAEIKAQREKDVAKELLLAECREAAAESKKQKPELPEEATPLKKQAKQKGGAKKQPTQ